MKRVMLALGALLGLGACTDSPGALSSKLAGSAPYAHGSLGTLTYRAVDLLVAGAPELRRSGPVMVTSITDTQMIEKSTPLGNIIADLVRSRLVQSGVAVSELRLRSAVLMNRRQGQGEMMLSRNPRALMVRAPDAAAIVTGTYAVGDNDLLVSLKAISATDARIISAADFFLPKYFNVNSLLSGDDQNRREKVLNLR